MKLISLFQFQHSIAHLRQIYQAKKKRHHVLLYILSGTFIHQQRAVVALQILFESSTGHHLR